LRPHIHTGFVAFVFAGVSALVFLNIYRFATAKLSENPNTETIGKAMGALVKF
jgi:hypothetical protein